MNENNLIGMNPYEARQNIQYFNNRVQSVYDDMMKNFAFLFEELSKNWFSPNAVNFVNRFNDSIDDMTKEVSSFLIRINEGATDAYNYVARTHGLPTIRYYQDLNMHMSVRHKIYEQNPLNNDVGMKIENVNNIILEFERRMNDVISRFHNLPKAIALYDDENKQRHYYSYNIRRLEDQITDFIGAVDYDIKRELESEIEKLNIAKSNSVNELI